MKKEDTKINQEKDLKAFLVTYFTSNREDPLNVTIVAFTKKEAGNIFIKWITDKGFYKDVLSIAVQRLRKTNKNKKFFTLDFYNKQNKLVFVYNSDILAFHKAGLN